MIIIVFILGGDESVKHRTSAHSAVLGPKLLGTKFWSLFSRNPKIYFGFGFGSCPILKVPNFGFVLVLLVKKI